MKYVLIDMLKNGDMFNQEFNEKAAAISAAQNAWNSLTEHDKKRRESFYVLESINPDAQSADHFDGDIILSLI